MKIEDFKKVTNDIMSNLSDQGKVTEYLTQLNDAYETTLTTNTTLQDQSKTHEKEIQALKDTNMKLFLKVQAPESDSAADSQTLETEPKLSYEKLTEDLGGTTTNG